MHRPFRSILISFSLLLCLFLLLNMNVSAKQGINYKWHTIKLPLYLKALDFFDRHYNYAYRVREIIAGAHSSRERAERIFEWTCNNIRKTPGDLPVIDDHVWYIIVRGYGAEDQFADVFATLCNYAKLKAFYSKVYSRDKKTKLMLSFVQIDGKWRMFDPYRGVYFLNKNGDLFDVNNDLPVVGNLLPVHISGSSSIETDYFSYLGGLPIETSGVEFKRSGIQSPLRRLIFETRKRE